MCLSLPVLRAGRSLERSRFWVNRFWRIVPPYWVALAIFAALSVTAFGLPSAQTPKRSFELFQEALFLTGFNPAYNSSFWTLEFETHWYIFFPFILALFMKSRALFFALILGLYLWYLTPVRVPDAGMLPCFMLGIVAADLYLRGLIRSKLWLAVAAATLALAIILRSASDDHGDPLWHAAAFRRSRRPRSGLKSPILETSRLYRRRLVQHLLIHGPVLAWTHDTLHAPLILAALVSLAAGIAFWALIERPMSKPGFRDAVASIFPWRSKRSEAAR